MGPAIAVAALGGLLLGAALDALARRLAGGPPAPPPSPPRAARAAGASAARRATVAAVTASLFAAVVAVRHDDPPRLVLGLVLVAFLVPLALVDLDERRLPNVLTAPAAVLAVALGLALDPAGEPERLAAGAAAGGFFLVAALARPRGMGIGDVKLAAVLGLFLGREVAAAVLLALVAGVALGAAIIVRKGAAEGRRTAIAFGPFLALGGVFAVLAGDVLVDAYVTTY
jgi:leader peptidase (prepilin peptidase) / N-methyltransferase